MGLIGGVIADATVGDPQRGHPVALFGRVMTALEKRVYADSAARGAAHAGCGLAIATAPAFSAIRLARAAPAGRTVITALTTWAVVAARSLSAAAAQVGAALTAGDLEHARALLPGLCGRDPAMLDSAAVTRAVIESVAENTSDAIVAPLLWGALAGPVGLSAYRAVNTLDAMIGHHSPRYERFGRASARMDDVANWMPARMTALLAAMCAPTVGGIPRIVWQTARRYGHSHPSLNAGWCEAAFAGALGLRLGGPLSYSGRAEQRPELGTGRTPAVADIDRAIRLSRCITLAATTVAAACALAGPEPGRSARGG
jgi:adenosylcobinamide-phosphate synthase